MHTIAATPVEQRGFRWLPKALWPPPAAPPITDPEEIRANYAHFRPRILFWTTVGYGAFYFVRKNLPLAMPVMEHQLGIGKAQLGLFLTLHGVLYGVSKFANGVVGDRADGRKFMALGLAASAVINVFFGFSTALLAFGILWMLNGWFQGMGYPPCARLLSHWFSPGELATKMSFWNASHSLGAAGVLILCGYLLQLTQQGPDDLGDWRICFFVPAGIALLVAAALMWQLRDTPESVGLPEIAGSHVAATANESTQSPAEFRAFLWHHVFSDKYIWLVSAANFFVYVLRYGVFDWGPTMLKEFKGIELHNAAWMVAGFEFAGLLGAIFTGWLTDRLFGGRAAPLCLAAMILAGVMVYLLWKAPAHQLWLNAVLLMGVGFFVYAPQSLVAVIVVKLATKRAAATAVGLTSIFGYASTVVSGWGLGELIDRNKNWDLAFICLIGAAVCGAILFAAALPAKADNYARSTDDAV
jgi:sugar phosphate permease